MTRADLVHVSQRGGHQYMQSSQRTFVYLKIILAWQVSYGSLISGISFSLAVLIETVLNILEQTAAQS